jgi:hypothetical protein
MTRIVDISRDEHFVVVKYAHACQSEPGQCVIIDGKYFAIAENQDGVLTVLGRTGGPLDRPTAAEVVLAGPIGNGFKGIDCESAVIIAGGTAIGTCLSVLDHRTRRGLKTWFVSYARSQHPFAERVSAAGGINWNTAGGRPASPYDPLGVNMFPNETRVFVAGPNDLVNSVRNCAEKFNILTDNINLNY